MDIFTDWFTTKNGQKILLCGICEEGGKESCRRAYADYFKAVAFLQTTDEFYLDYLLMEHVVKASPKEVLAVGASIAVSGVIQRSGGIIGNPFDNQATNDDSLEDLGGNLYCVGFPGRVGFVVHGTKDGAVQAKKALELLLAEDNEKIVSKAREILNDFDLYILVSDGSGAGGYPYVCGKKGALFEEQSIPATV